MSTSAPSSVGFDAHQVAQQMLDLNALGNHVEETLLPSQRTTGENCDMATQAPDSTPRGRLPNALTDRANAELFATMYGGRFRYVAGNGWYVWESGRWKLRGGEGEAIWAAGDMASQMPSFDRQGRFSAQEVIKHRRYSSSTSGLRHYRWMPRSSTATRTPCARRRGWST
jgi:putative DNA primase/helicase